MIELQGNLQTLGERSNISALIAEIDGAISERLRAYFTYRTLSVVDKPKAIKDCVWGMIDLSPSEVFLVDSPLLQRLRRIKQLGLSSVTYPTAGYSRFEHTLGVVHQAERLLNAVVSRSNQRGDSAENRTCLRLAALLHDVGHGPFSHVSESYFSPAECNETTLVDAAVALKDCFKTALRVPSPKLSESLSVVISMTASVRELLHRAGFTQQQYNTALPLIVGMPPSTEQAFLGQLLSNVIDADKLDYMFRDAQFSGVPLPVDLERLLYKLYVKECAPNEVRELVGHFPASTSPALVLATDLAGIQHARDLSYARNLLYERVYGHHKTRAAERVALALMCLRKLTLAQLATWDDSALLTARNDDTPQMADLSRQLSDRELPHRVFAMQYEAQLEMPPALEASKLYADEFKENQTYGWLKMQSALERYEGRKAFEQDIKDHLTALSVAQEGKTIWIDPPRDLKAPPITLLIFAPDGSRVDEYFRGEAASHPQSRFASSFIYQSGFPKAEIPLLYIAIEKAFAARFGLYFGRRAADYSKIGWSDVENAKRRLESQTPDYFADAGLIRPHSLHARTIEASSRIDALVERFSEFSRCKVTKSRILSFLDQFPESLAEPILRTLEAIRFFSRAAIVSALQNLAIPSNSVLVPLNKGLQKSSSILAYFSGDLQGFQMVSLSEALEGTRSITFLEDCIISGRQPTSVIQLWCGEAPECNESGLAEALNLHLRVLKDRNPVFRFIVGAHAGIDYFSAAAQAHGFTGDVRVAETAVPWTGEPALRDFLANVGEALLKSTKQVSNSEKWTDAVCRTRALGYTSSGLLLVFAHNVPTGTVTALWSKGIFNGAPWLPLFERRENSANDSPTQPPIA